MHIVILHGYILQGTGSNIYVANIAKAWKQLGHKITILCQDRTANKLPFVDEFIFNSSIIPNSPPSDSTIRVIIPNINNLLPVYVKDKYEGYKVKTIQEMSDAEIGNHISLVADTLRNICLSQKVDRVFVNHALLNPVIAYEALKNTNIPYDVKIHGSAIEFSLVPSPRLMKYAFEPIKNAEKIIAGTQHIKNRIIEVFNNKLSKEKIKIIPPGMDPSIFKISENFDKNLSAFKYKIANIISQDCSGRNEKNLPPIKFTSEILPKDLNNILIEKGNNYNQRVVDSDILQKLNLRQENQIIFYFGKFLQTKGVGELLSIAPKLIKSNPNLRFIFSGFGNYREHMEELLNAFEENNLKKALCICKAGNFISEIDLNKYFFHIPKEIRKKIIITGFLSHNELTELLPLAEVCVAPSKLAEAFGMVAAEAMSCGVIPICNNHSGLKDILDILTSEIPEITDITVTNQACFFDKLPTTIENALEYIKSLSPTEKLKLKEKVRTLSVKHFSWDKIARNLVGG